MAVIGNLNLEIYEDGTIHIYDTFIWGDDYGSQYAFSMRTTDDDRSLGRIEINYMTRPLDERYARFCARLEKAQRRLLI